LPSQQTGDAVARHDSDDTLRIITTYFNLSVPLSSLYETWSKADPNFARRAPSFTGIRILNQDAWEALVAFICSSNNNISRIGQMVSKLCRHFGPYVGDVAAEPFHDFPTPEALAADGVEARLRELGFGYRAKYIAETALIVLESPADWLLRLRNPMSPALGQVDDIKLAALSKDDAKTGLLSTPLSDTAAGGYKAAHEALLTLTGVGPKVADCVCLMGLGWAEAVPVDTHVWQIAQRDYKFGGGGKGKGKTFNKAVHDAVGDHFRAIWGPYAGWAQSVLFTANLKAFADQAAEGRKTETVELEEAVVKVEEKENDPPVTVSTRTTRKRKMVVKMEVKREIRRGDENLLTADIKPTGTRTSKRRRVQKVV
jgi:N-glycosylase/DNA lyase